MNGFYDHYITKVSIQLPDIPQVKYDLLNTEAKHLFMYATNMQSKVKTEQEHLFIFGQGQAKSYDLGKPGSHCRTRPVF